MITDHHSRSSWSIGLSTSLPGRGSCFVQSICWAWLNPFPQNNLPLWQGICEYRVPLDSLSLLLTARYKDGCQDVLVGLNRLGFFTTLLRVGADLSGSDDILRHHDYTWRRGWANLEEKVLTGYSVILSGEFSSNFLDDASGFDLPHAQESISVAVGFHCSHTRWAD